LPPPGPTVPPAPLPGPELSPPGTSSPAIVWGLGDLTRAAGTAIPWLWQGYLAPGLLTLLTGRPGLGLTTLAEILLARMGTGGPLAGLTLAPGKAVVITGDSPVQCWRRNQLLGTGNHVGWMCRPFRN